MIKTLYKSIFVLFFKLGAGQWPGYVNADVHKGVAGVTLIQAILLLSASDWLQITSGRQIQAPHWLIWVGILFIYGVNYYILAFSGDGVAFEEQFSRLEKEKRRALYAGAICACLVSIAILWLSIAEFRSTFHIVFHVPTER